jgi:MoxR-like ATPase
VLHPLTNERYVNMEDITGEIYRLHKDSLVVLALNPYYEGGIERIPTALRARLKTLEIPMVTDESRLYDIVLVNAPGAEKIEQKVKKLCRQTAAVCRAWEEITTSQNLYSNDRLVQNVGSELQKPDIAGNVIEAPSPRALVQAVRSILEGEDVFDAIRHHLVNTIVRDFGVTANCLINLYRTL